MIHWFMDGDLRVDPLLAPHPYELHCERVGDNTAVILVVVEQLVRHSTDRLLKQTFVLADQIGEPGLEETPDGGDQSQSA